jgi:hypothetical protein
MTDTTTETAPDTATDNLAHGPLAGTEHILARLRNSEFYAEFSKSRRLSPGIMLASGGPTPAEGRVSSRPGELCTLDILPQEGTRWISFQVDLDALDNEPGRKLVCLVRASANRPAVARISLRSGESSAGSDYTATDFPKRLIASGAPGLHIDLLDLGDIPAEATWRRLVLSFEVGPLDLTLHDLQLVLI